MPRMSLTRKGYRPLVLLAVLSLGAFALYATGFEDLYLGTGAGNPATSTGDRNTAIGEYALSSNTSGNDNSAVGAEASFFNTTGSANTSLGSFALGSNTTGSVNTAVGAGALPSNTTGNSNSAFGTNALDFNTTGDANTAIGYRGPVRKLDRRQQHGGRLQRSGQRDRLRQHRRSAGSAGSSIGSGSNNIDIGNSAPGNESEHHPHRQHPDQAFLAGVNGATCSSGVAVYVNSSGQLGTVTSSLRFKEDVEDMGDGDRGSDEAPPGHLPLQGPV